MRGAAQLISYEVSQALALVGVLITAGTLSLTGIVHAQQGMWFFIPQFVGFLIFMTASFAETNRTPFDLVEADAELVGGYFTEYGGTPFVAYLFAEYTNMIVVSGIAVTMFFGGWLLPFGIDPPGWVDPFVVLAKILVVLTFFIWIRATLPRLRYDQLMSFGWKMLLPLATLNLLVTAIVVVHMSSLLRPRRRRHRGGPRPRRGSVQGAYRVFGETLRGLKTTFCADRRGADDDPVPGGEDARLPALPRPP